MKKYNKLTDIEKQSAQQVIDMLRTVANNQTNQIQLDNLACKVLLKFINDLKYQNITTSENAMLARSKYNNDKARYRRKAKIYRKRINEALGTLQKGINFEQMTHDYSLTRDYPGDYDILLQYIIKSKKQLIGEDNYEKE